jgi:hypothetical protein
MINASGWQPPPGFDLRKRPWYVMTLVQSRLDFYRGFCQCQQRRDDSDHRQSRCVMAREGTLLGVVGGDVSVGTVTKLVVDKEDRYNLAFPFWSTATTMCWRIPDYPRDRLTGKPLDADHLRAVQKAEANPGRRRESFAAWQRRLSRLSADCRNDLEAGQFHFSGRFLPH